jgi:hypothetical protein
MDRAELIKKVIADAKQRGFIKAAFCTFDQMHTDSTLGLGRKAGAQAITTAPTVIMFGENRALVYFGGEFGYEAQVDEALEWTRPLRAPTCVERERTQQVV